VTRRAQGARYRGGEAGDLSGARIANRRSASADGLAAPEPSGADGISPQDPAGTPQHPRAAMTSPNGLVQRPHRTNGL
jgi:hypothetical protein